MVSFILEDIILVLFPEGGSLLIGKVHHQELGGFRRLAREVKCIAIFIFFYRGDRADAEGL